MKAKCYECAYRGSVPGSAHIACRFAWAKSEHPIPLGKEHGVRNGWWVFPMDFDPVWMISECPAFADEADPEMIAEHGPLDTVLAMLAGTGRLL